MRLYAVIAAVAFQQLVPTSTPLPSADALVDDVQKLSVAPDNGARFDALTGLLRARGIAFTIVPFSLEKPIGAEPRTEGRNVVASIGDGEGSGEILVGAHYDAVRLRDGSLSAGAVDNA